MYRILLFCFLFVAFFEAQCEGQGSLIVTYQTGRKAERLERVRFWVKDSNHKQYFFPKEHEFVETSDDHIRMVVIEDLSPGSYTVQFLVPNNDNRFKKTPIRKIEVIEGGVARLDQRIKIRRSKKEEIVAIETGSLIVFYDTGERGDLLEQVRFSLTDDEGNSLTYPIEGELVEEPLTGGLSFTIENLPVGTYSLDFFLTGSEDSFGQESIHFEIPSGKTEAIHKSLAILERSVSTEEEAVVAEG